MSRTPSACPLDCPDSCGVLVEVGEDGSFQRLRGNPDHPWSRGSLCGKTAIYDALVHSPERLRTPLVRRAGELAPASWDEALDRIAAGLDGLPGERMLALHYAGNMGLVQRGYPQRVANALSMVGTDGAICDSTAELGHELVLGRAVGPDLTRLDEADLLLLWGSDARRTVQHLMPRVRDLCRAGVPVFVLDVWRTDTIRQVEAWGGRGLCLAPGTDALLALGLVELAFQRGHVDLAALGRDCVGAAEFRAEVAGRYPLDDVVAGTGLARQEVEHLSSALARSQRAWIKTGIGWTRRRNGGAAMRAVASLAACYGCADRLHFESGEHFGLDVDCVRRPDLRRADAPAPIRHVELGAELATGRFNACLVWGHNPALTVPDSRAVTRGLERPDLFVVVHDLFLTETARRADVVLPATALPEHTDVFRSYGHRVLQLSRKACDARQEERSNVAAFSALARRLDLPREVWDVDEEALVLELLERNRARFRGDELARVLAGEPVQLGPRDLAGRGTPSGRIELASARAEALGAPRVPAWIPDDGGGGGRRFWLLAAPSVATHNSTYLHSARHLARQGEPVCHLHPGDARDLALSAGDRARLENDHGALTLAVVLCEDLPRGVVRIDGFPDPRAVPEGFSTNALTSPRTADLADGSVQYSARVDVVPA